MKYETRDIEVEISSGLCSADASKLKFVDEEGKEFKFNSMVVLQSDSATTSNAMLTIRSDDDRACLTYNQIRNRAMWLVWLKLLYESSTVVKVLVWIFIAYMIVFVAGEMFGLVGFFTAIAVLLSLAGFLLYKLTR